jgi:TetR/AcrR family transcriptional repressor of mexJK operon
MRDTIESIAMTRPGRPKRQSDAERCAQLIDAAEALFLEGGFNAGTMSDIARLAGMSKKTVYQLFPSKQALFNELLERRLSVLSMPVQEDGRDPQTVLVELLLGTAAFMMSPKQVAMMRLMIAESPRTPEIGIALQRLGLGRGNGALERWLASPSARGLLRIQDPQEAAHMLFGCAIGEPLLKLLAQCAPPPDVAEIEARVRRTVALFLIEPPA